MHHADFNAHRTMGTPRATIGRHALKPAPIRADRRPTPARWVRLALILAAATMLVACGGGGGDELRADVQCNPDSWDCASMYTEYPFRAVPDDAQGPDIYTFNPAPRAGFTIVTAR